MASPILALSLVALLLTLQWETGKLLNRIWNRLYRWNARIKVTIMNAPLRSS